MGGSVTAGPRCDCPGTSRAAPARAQHLPAGQTPWDCPAIPGFKAPWCAGGRTAWRMLFHTEVFCGSSKKQAQVSAGSFSSTADAGAFPGVAAARQPSDFYLFHVSASFVTFCHGFPSPI